MKLIRRPLKERLGANLDEVRQLAFDVWIHVNLDWLDDEYGGVPECDYQEWEDSERPSFQRWWDSNISDR